MRHALFGQAGYQPYSRIIYPPHLPPFSISVCNIQSLSTLSLRVDIKRCLKKVVHDAVDLSVSGNCIHNVFSGGHITIVDQGKQVL
jgi:hypothetical protein